MAHSARLRSAITEYNRNLHQSGDASESFLKNSGSLSCETLRPLLLEQNRYSSIQKAAAAVIQAIRQLTALFEMHPELRSRLFLPEAQRSLLDQLGWSARESYWPGRLDGFLNRQGEIRFVEFNAGTPGGVYHSDFIRDAFAAFKPLQSLNGDFQLKSIPMKSLLVENVLRGYEAATGLSHPRMAFLAPPTPEGLDQALAYPEIQGLLQIFKDAEVDADLISFDSLELKQEKLFSDGRRVDACLVLDWQSVVSRLPRDHLFWEAIREKMSWIVNPAGTAILAGNKSLFELLTDPEWTAVFDSETRLALARHLPWTRALQDRKAEYRGENVDLLTFAEHHREDLVLKPAFAVGGEGVVLGWQCDAPRWRSCLREAVEGNFVIQERVEISKEEFPFWANGQLHFEERQFDCNPYVWPNGLVEGALIRISRSDLLNVNGGATCGALFVLGSGSDGS